MRNRSKVLLVALTAAITLGALVSVSGANRLASSASTFKVSWAAMKLIGFATVTCKVTLEGSYHSKTIAKVAESLIGYISKATVQECTGGSATPVGLPWHVRYQSFGGALPEITSITQTTLGSFKVTAIGVECIFTGTAASPMKGIISRNTATKVATSLRVEEPSAIPKSSGGGLCGTSGRLEGTSSSLKEGGGANITVELK